MADAGTLLRQVADAHPHEEAFVESAAAVGSGGQRRLTFADWDRQADAVAAHFQRRGVSHGEVVALLLPSCADYAVCYQAAMRLGAITTGINPRLGPREAASILERTTPRVIVLDPGVAKLPPGDWRGTTVLRSELAEAVSGGGAQATFPAVSKADPVAIVWTSGTTGVPKGAVFDHGCLEAMAAGAGVLSAPGDRRLSPLPFAHVGYMTRMWDELIHVITTVILPTPWTAAEHLRLIDDERVTVGQGVPTQWSLVLEEAGQASGRSLRITSSGGAMVPPELIRRLRQRFGAPFVVRYTSTEACISTGTALDDDDETIATTVGRPAPGVELRLADEADGVGEVCLRSRAAMRGYWNDAARTADVIDGQGWIHTGDLGRIDGRGNLVLAGRKIEMFTRGGYNVYPAEVEAVIEEHPSVARAAVVGLPDPVLGSIGVAAIVPASGHAAVGLDELRAWCRERLANYKAPDRVVVRTDLPLTSMLKVDKRALTAELT